MKKIFSYIAIAVSGVIAFSGCNALDLGPIDYAASGNYWRNEAQVESEYYGILNQLRGSYSYPFVLGEVRGGTLKQNASIEGVSTSYQTIARNALNKDDTGVTNWAGYFSRILQVNNYIEQVRDHCEFFDDASRNKWLAPIYGIRAYYYFMLYRTYGGVPLEEDVVLFKTNKLDEYYKARSGAADIMQFLKDEIGRSETAYGSDRSHNPHEWSYYATEMLKAQIYMWAAKVTTDDGIGKFTATGNSDLTVAQGALKNVLGGPFQLLDDYASIFSADNKGNAEEIFALFFSKDETTNAGTQFVYQAAIWNNSFYDEDGNLYGDPLDLKGGGMHRDEYIESFVKAFDKTDQRRAATFHECYSSADPANRTFGSAMLKYMGHAEGSNRYYDSDVIIFRLSDAILMMAEVENGLGNPSGAVQYINQIRKRAYGSNYSSAVEFKTSDFATTELAILRERDKEFVGEGSRWFDLVRMHDASGKPLAFSNAAAYPDKVGGSAKAVLSSSEAYKLLWPIDVNVLNGDPLLYDPENNVNQQNPGY
ncbi:MAG: RagB/SusD family nutrient uptake outer membrane protein [Bacteroidales bacterium]|nr:RagB/SusD family nutrient uptake outer membrane protein [Bacteroidales bacterium]